MPVDHDDFLRGLGQAIREARKSKKMTQEDLSELAGVNPKYLGEVELGKANPTVLFLLKLSWGLEMELTDLFLACGYQWENKILVIYGEIISLLRKLDHGGLQRVHKVIKAVVE